MLLDDETYEEIKGEVAHYLVRCGMSYPLDACEFARRMNLKMTPYSVLKPEAYFMAMRASEDSFLCEKNNAFSYVFFNDSKIEKRQDMSILHEIGHQVLDHNSTPNKSDEVKESEAKFFAKYAKAPMPLIHLLPIKTVETIQKAFGLSREAAGYALDNYKKWLEHFDGTYKDYELKILALERSELEAYISELNGIKKLQSECDQQLDWNKYRPDLVKEVRGHAVPLQSHNSTFVQRNLYEIRQISEFGGVM